MSTDTDTLCPNCLRWKTDSTLLSPRCECSLSPATGSDASKKPEMSDEELANKLLCVLSQEMIRKAELFDYLCWLEEKQQSETVPGALFLVLASDSVTCWGESYAQAVAEAMKHDAKPYGEHQNDEVRHGGPDAPN